MSFGYRRLHSRRLLFRLASERGADGVMFVASFSPRPLFQPPIRMGVRLIRYYATGANDRRGDGPCSLNVRSNVEQRSCLDGRWRTRREGFRCS